MRRSIFLSALVYALLLAGLIGLRGELIALAIPFMLYLFFGFWSAPEKLNLQIERKLSIDRTTPNSDVVVTLTVVNHGADINELLLDEKLSPRLTFRIGSPRHLLRLTRGSSHTFAYTIAGPRGTYAFDSIDVTATESFGLIRREQSIVTSEKLFIFPEVKRLKYVSIHPRRTRVYAGTIPARVGGTGTEFFGVRDYQPGDSPRMINWRVSAHHPENLYSNEYQQERVADVGIVLDARVRANLFHADQSIFEYKVAAVAAVSDALLSQGNRVGLLVYSAYLGWTIPGYGKIQRERIMQALTRAEVGISSVFAGLEHLSPRMFPRESQIVLVSSLVNDDLNVLVHLRGRGYQVMVISPDPVKFERGLLPSSSQVDLAARVIRMERDLLIRRLERAGIQVIEWDVSIPLDQAIWSDIDAAKEVTMTVLALVSSIIISIGSLAWGYEGAGFDIFVRWILIFGAMWLFTQWQGWDWFSSLGLFFVILLSAFGLWFGFTPGWLFSSAIFALFAWDMTDFRRRTRSMAVDDDSQGMERRHIARISLLSLAGLFLATLTMLVRVQFTFEWGALLVIVILLGLSQLVGWFGRHGK